jgi:NitT/TauT family transport system substrate-binding protein
LRRIGLSIILLASLWRSGTAFADRPVLDIQLNWAPTAGLIGFYAAEAHGLFAREGITVRLRHVSAPIDIVETVTSGAATLGVASGVEIVNGRLHGRKIRGIYALYQRNPIIMLALRRTGITRPEQIAGKRVRVSPDTVLTLRAMADMSGVPRGAYTELYLPPDPDLMLADQADTWMAHIDGLPARLDERAAAYNLILPDDYRVHGYGGVIFATDETIAAMRPALVGLVRAINEGLRWSLENPEEAATLIERYDPKANLSVVKERIIGLAPLVYNGAASLGDMNAAVWKATIDVLARFQPGAAPLLPPDVYTPAILRAVAAEAEQ